MRGEELGEGLRGGGVEVLGARGQEGARVRPAARRQLTVVGVRVAKEDEADLKAQVGGGELARPVGSHLAALFPGGVVGDLGVGQVDEDSQRLLAGTGNEDAPHQGGELGAFEAFVHERIIQTSGSGRPR
ncbi:MAG: hypothetical protein COV48_15145 [Elusimicrobia bacterium CG11_big_fil_rev_8_21_14_0_20_64_6]|nr:MAG: hypothetical protein COV48_15145 [Elusimicrobia bacterium CG11_big_fil_rev_8_21_14_0_20_64_6]